MSVTTGLLESEILLQDAAATNANGNVIDCRQYGLVALFSAAAAAWDGTLNFEGTADGSTTFVSIRGEDIATGVLATTATGATLSAIRRFDVSGLTGLRARITGRTAGNVTVRGRGVPA